MAEKGHPILSPRTLCFGLGLGFLGMIFLALFMFYPALLSLFFGGGANNSIPGTGWSMPLLLLSLIMGGWFLLGMFALLRPVLITQILLEFLKKGLKNGVGASQQFKHGRAFVLGSLAGQVLVWPAAIFAGILVSPFAFGYGGWFSMLAGILGGLFFLALFLRLFAPGLLSIFGRNPAGSMLPTAWPFVSGMMVSGIVAAVLAVLGVLPPLATGIQTANKRQIGEGQTTSRTNEDARYYVTWKDGQSVEIETTFCANGMSVFLPRDKGFIGTSTDPDSVVYDPYADGTNAIGIGGASSSVRDSAAETVRDNPEWVRDMGAPSGLGSGVYRGEKNLDGYDFLDGSHIFTAKAFVTSPGGRETETEALLVPTGCAQHFSGSDTLRQVLLSSLDGVAHLVLNKPGLGDTSGFSLITDIPVLDLKSSDEVIDEMLKLIAAQGGRQGPDGPPIIMVARWTRDQETENRKIEEAKIRKALAARQRSNVTWISAGQLSPFCNVPQPYCTALNNSTTVYVSNRGAR